LREFLREPYNEYSKYQWIGVFGASILLVSIIILYGTMQDSVSSPVIGTNNSSLVMNSSTGTDVGNGTITTPTSITNNDGISGSSPTVPKTNSTF